MNILLVEDQKDDEELFKEILLNTSFHGSTIQTAKTLGEVNGLVNSFSPDIIVLDLHLPDSRGIDTFLQVRELYEKVPVVVFTIEKDESIAQETIAQGADDYLVKGMLNKAHIEKSFRKAEEHNRLHQALLSTVEDLKKTNQNLEHFAYVASHDLRAPLINLKGLLSLHEGVKNDQPNNQNLLERMKDTVSTMENTLDSLIQVLKIHEFAGEPSQHIEFQSVINKLKKEFSEELGQGNTQIHADFSKAPFVFFPYSKLFIVLTNLLSNAVKFRHPDRPLVIRMKTEPVGEDCICFSIEDNGIGFDDKINGQRIFQLFNKINPSLPGRGTGLYITKSILESYSGKIEVESYLGEGTIFKAYFNIKEK